MILVYSNIVHNKSELFGKKKFFIILKHVKELTIDLVLN